MVAQLTSDVQQKRARIKDPNAIAKGELVRPKLLIFSNLNNILLCLSAVFVNEINKLHFVYIFEHQDVMAYYT